MTAAQAGTVGHVASTAACGAPIHAVIDLPAPTIELPIDGLAAPVETPIDAIATRVQALGRHVTPGGLRAIRGAIETPIRVVAPSIEPVLDPVAAFVEAPLDTIAATVGALRGIRPNLRGANQQSQTEPYCTAFHDRPP